MPICVMIAKREPIAGIPIIMKIKYCNTMFCETIKSSGGVEVPESFMALCRMVEKQLVTYSDAWAIMKDIVRLYEDKPKGEAIV